MDDKDKLTNEIKAIDKKLHDLQCKIDEFENEKQKLLNLKLQFKKQIKNLTPSSVGGLLDDNSKNWNRTDFQWSTGIDKCLKDVFHLTQFRPLQLETINAVLSKTDCIVVLPTGGGKSLCYQLPAVYETGVTIVVSPLISLIEDQLWSLRRLSIYAASLNSSTSKEDSKQIQQDMFNKDSKLKIIYVTPEKLAKSKAFMNKLEKLYEQNLFKFLVIDEIHCCSTYGHDFRPDYKFLGIMKRQYPNVPILGLTATATSFVIDDIKKILNLSSCVLFKASFNRPNIFYEIKQKPDTHAACMDDIGKLIKTKFNGESGIVYCFSQRESEEIAQELSARGIKADCYHANLPSSVRSSVHEKWTQNKVHVIVATIAFGMGIDKSSVKFVIHHSLSKSLENFYQESGRAGRNNEPAFSVLYFKFADIFRQSSLVFTEQTGLKNLYTMINYCIDQTECKRNIIARHFNDTQWPKYGDCNRMCDYCKGLGENRIENREVNCIDEVKLIIDVIDRNTKGKDKRLTANKLLELVQSEFKKSKTLKYTLAHLDIEKLIIKMLMEHYLKEDFHFTPYNTICYLIKGELAEYALQNGNYFGLIVNVSDLSYKTLKRKLDDEEKAQNSQASTDVKDIKKQKTHENDSHDVITVLDDSDDEDFNFLN